MEELKPCPRCSSEQTSLHDYHGEVAPICWKCKLSGPYLQTPDEAIEWWNTRATDPPEDITGLAHELWALAQLMPEEGIIDGVMRIEEALQGKLKGTKDPLLEKMAEALEAILNITRVTDGYDIVMDGERVLQKYREKDVNHK